MIGYFPTYALGNMYAAQFFAAAGRDLGELIAGFSRGEFAPLKAWLKEKIHRRGQSLSGHKAGPGRDRRVAFSAAAGPSLAAEIRRTVPVVIRVAGGPQA